MIYPFNVYFTEVEGHKFWIAECKSLRGCVGQGETADEAIAELELNEKAWLETAAEVGIPIPKFSKKEDTNPNYGESNKRPEDICKND